MAAHDVLLVGLTGGIAGGKSTVARLLAAHGCVVTDADRIVADLYRPGEAGTAAVVELFGADLLDGEGAVDKAALSARVFSDHAARRRLEAAIHPLVGQAFRALVARSRGIVVFEATLLVETGGYRNYDVVVTVEAPDHLRLERATARGLDRAAAQARMAAQTTSAERRRVADFTIDNAGTLDELDHHVATLVAALRHRLAAKIAQHPPPA